jgi:orotate phosphoribosyltransferase
MFEECRIEGDFTLSSGRSSDVFYDFDLLTPREAAEYVEQLLRQMDPVFDWNEVDFIAAPAVGGIVPAFLVSFAKDKPLVIIDKEGSPRGPEFSTGKYLIVDDVITSFSAANRVVEALPESNCLGVAAYIFRGSYEDLNKQSFNSYYLARKEQETENAGATGS